MRNGRRIASFQAHAGEQDRKARVEPQNVQIWIDLQEGQAEGPLGTGLFEAIEGSFSVAQGEMHGRDGVGRDVPVSRDLFEPSERPPGVGLAARRRVGVSEVRLIIPELWRWLKVA